MLAACWLGHASCTIRGGPARAMAVADAPPSRLRSPSGRMRRRAPISGHVVLTLSFSMIRQAAPSRSSYWFDFSVRMKTISGLMPSASVRG